MCINVYELLILVLSILVTVLIGWNIWTAIDAKRKIDGVQTDILDFKQNVNNAIEEQKKQNEKKMAEHAYASIVSRAQIEEDFAKMLGLMPESDVYPQTIWHAIKAMSCWSAVYDFKNASACASYVLMHESTISTLSKKEKDELVGMIKSIPHQNDIDNIEKLYAILQK